MHLGTSGCRLMSEAALAPDLCAFGRKASGGMAENTLLTGLQEHFPFHWITGNGLLV